MENQNHSDDKHAALKKRIQAWSLVVAVVVLIPIFCGFVYFQNRDNIITSLYFRSLSEIEHQINNGLKSIDYLLDYALVESNTQIHPFCSEDKTKKYCKQYKSYFSKYSNSLRHIRFIDCIDPNAPCENYKTNSKAVKTITDRTLFKVTGVVENRKITVYEPKQKLAARIPLRDLINPSPALKYFNEILLLDKQGNILYRSGADDIFKTHNFDAHDDFARFENLFQYLQTDTVVELDLSRKKLENLKVEAPPSHSTIREATIGNISYLLFVQPFHAAREQFIALRSNPQMQSDSGFQADKLAYLVGVVSKKKHFFDVITLPLGRITILLFGLLFIILLVPHIKLKFSGPHYMPSRTLLASIAISLPLLVVLLVSGFLSARDYFRLKRGLDQTAKLITAKIQHNFMMEFETLTDFKICDYEHDKSVSVAPGQRDDDRHYVVNASIAEPNDSSFYPNFELAYALDNDGHQLGKQVVFRDFPSAHVRVAKRDYFNQPRLRPEYLLSWPSGDGDETAKPFYSERIQTYDQGMKLTAFSRPGKSSDLQTPCQALKKEPKVQALVKLMHTFFRPVMPLGFGFAVVEDLTGNVLYHSNDQRSLMENFYIETDQNENLIAAVRSRHAQSIEGVYNGVFHGFYPTPLSHTPWTLVIFYDYSLMELSHLKGSVFTLVFAAFLTIFTLIPLYFLYKFAPDWVERLAPHGKFCISTRIRLGNNVKYFNHLYVIVAELLLVIPFSLITWLTYDFEFGKQMERLSKLNLIHVGHQLLGRKNDLSHEVGRLIDLDNITNIKSIKYLSECSLYQFSIYTTSSNLISKTNSKTCLESFSASHPYLWLVTIDENIACKFRTDQSDPALPFEELLPLLSRLDADHRLMMYNNASDSSWSFHENGPKTLRAQLINHGNQQCLGITGNLVASDRRLASWTTSGMMNLFLNISYAIVVLTLFFDLIALIGQRLLGLQFPGRNEWRNYIDRFQSEPIVDLIPVSAENDGIDQPVLIERNLKKITSGQSEALLELKTILFNRSQGRLINTDNTEPLMWLILSGLFQYNKRGIDFRSTEMKKWVRAQNWSKQVHSYELKTRTDLWSTLAPAFYTMLMLAVGFLILSGGHVGELMITLFPLVLAGGLPFISQLFEKFVKD